MPDPKSARASEIPSYAKDRWVKAFVRLDKNLPRLALGALCAALLALFLAFPTFPNYDSYYSLLWAQEIWNGQKPVLDTFRAPTQHPLAVVFSMVLVPLGEDADRVLVFGALASLVVLATGVCQLATLAFNRWVGLTAGLFLVTNWNVVLLAARGYLDIPYLALVTWAAVLEARQRRRGLPVMLLLALAGTLRPEAWVLSGLYGLWMAWDGARPWRGLRRTLTRRGTLWLAAGVTPTALWLTVDLVITGNPLFSQTYTSGLAEQLGRTRGPASLPFTMMTFLKSIDGTAQLIAGGLGLLMSLWIVPRRAALPAVLLVVGLSTFLLLGLGGFSVIDRYLLVPAALLLLFAGVFAAGWTMMPAGRSRTWWSRVSLVGTAGMTVIGVMSLNVGARANDLRFRGDAHRDLRRVLNRPAVQDALLTCGPLWTPNHKLVPESRWILESTVVDVLARSMLNPSLVDRQTAGFDSPDRRRGRESLSQMIGARRFKSPPGRDLGANARDALVGPVPAPGSGVVIVPSSRMALLRQAYVVVGDDRPFDATPPTGFSRIATTTHYAVYASCGTRSPLRKR